MDCFFAACEEKYSPDIKGKPVIIGALPTDKRGVVATANYEARKYGIHSAMPITKAHHLCPSAIFIRPSIGRYKEESKNVFSILKRYSKIISQVSIDEAYFDISYAPNPHFVAKSIQAHILKETGLTCSIGIAQSKYVAKIASDFKKPFAITYVKSPKEFLHPLKVGKISGVGKVTRKKLNTLGIYTVGDLAAYDTQVLQDKFGPWMIHFQKIARGLDKTAISLNRSSRKSFSKERTFQEDKTFEECKYVIPTIAAKLFQETGNISYKTVSIKVRYANFITFTRDFSLNHPHNDAKTIERVALNLFNKTNKQSKVRLIGVKLSNLKTTQLIQKTIPSFY